VVSGGDAAEVLEAAESAFDKVPALIGGAVERMVALSRWIVWDHGRRASGEQEAAQRVAIISGVGCRAARGRRLAHQRHGGASIAKLARRDGKRYWPALAVHQGMDFGGAAAARAAYGLGESPP
jgi:hypothetical protein